MKLLIPGICVVGVFALLSGAPNISYAQGAPASQNACSTLDKMRKGYREMNTAMAKERTRKVSEEKEEFDAEDTGCFGDWGTNIGLGLPGLADAFFDQLKDQACSAMNDYVNSQLDALSSSISGPLDLVGLDVSFGGEQPFNLSSTEKKIGLDTGSIVDDVFKGAPDLEDSGIGGFDGQVGKNPLGDQDLDDIYLNQGRGESIPTPNWNPSAGGRGQ
ncbi:MULTISPECIES: hypothetical protein [Marinobacter]|uniref:Uncharacterized protein n=1 Tax=Marinobacter nauticus (strain ATCC 700491 / DSM 11845 / VT8) TaxID=351348 RepID=A1U805_MARN8|nr:MULTISPECIES: hypothetical protein [Marinobacter]ABM21124.1 hypothetical protein Maqu_4273 [Marinobacter nauticus VT8]